MSPVAPGSATPAGHGSLRARVTLAVALWLGFWVLAATVLGLLSGIALLDVLLRGRLSVGGFFAAILAFRLAWALVPWPERFVAPGARLMPEDAPGIFRALRELSVRTAVPPPDEVYLVPEANAFVAERGGARGWRRRSWLGVGLGLLAVLPEAELRAVIAHEFGHRHAGDLRLGPWVYRTRLSIARTLSQLGASTVVGLPFAVYARVFLRLTRAVSREQELAADALAAELCGPQTLAAALRRVHRDGLAWDLYWDLEVLPLLELGVVPPILEGFAAFGQSERARLGVAEAARVRADRSPTEEDSHPSLADRLAALGDRGAIDRLADGPCEAVAAAWSLQALELRLVRAVVPGGTHATVRRPGEPGAVPEARTLLRLSWEEVGERAWVPRYRLQITEVALDDEVLARLGSIAPDPQAMRALLRSAGDGIQSEEARLRLARELVIRAIVVRLFDAGWRVRALAGEAVHCRRGDESVDPRVWLSRLTSGNVAPAEWTARYRGWIEG